MTWIILAVAATLGIGLVRLLFAGWTPSWSANASRDLVLPLTQPQAFAAVEVVVRSLPRLVDVRSDVDRWYVEATTARDVKTMGVLVSVSVSSMGERATRVLIACRTMTPQWYDWGETRRLANEIAGRLASDGTATGARLRML